VNSDFADRLELVMDEKFIKHSPTVLANLFNPKFVGGSITPHTARNWLLGNSLPTHDKLIHLAKLLDTSAEYLRYGRHTEKTFVINESDGSETELTSTQQQFLRRYLKLTQVQQRIVNEMVGELVSST
jgi:transcriptional regulator with XRE-family HTH domain